jgi:transposase-like protein
MANQTEEYPMPKQRRNFSGAEKMAILREHLIEKVPISEVCDKHGLPPTMFYQWQKKLFEEGAAVFEQPRRKSSRQEVAESRKIEALEAKMREKNEVLAELMGEHVALKKTLGDL